MKKLVCALLAYIVKCFVRITKFGFVFVQWPTLHKFLLTVQHEDYIPRNSELTLSCSCTIKYLNKLFLFSEKGRQRNCIREKLDETKTFLFSNVYQNTRFDRVRGLANYEEKRFTLEKFNWKNWLKLKSCKSFLKSILWVLN